MRAPQIPPPLDIPPSQNTVSISIIDTTSYMSGFPASTFVEPAVPGFELISAGSYGYMIKHPTSTHKHATLLFDLGVRKDWQNLPEPSMKDLEGSGGSIRVGKDVATTLREHGQDLNEIGAIVWSHWHFDHVGDPTTFPTSTDLIVGPGFKAKFIPAYPTARDSHVDERAWQDRELLEIDFQKGSKALKIGKFDAYDFYGDGSFYLLNSPGHAIGHVSGLARTTADPPTFILLGADIAHHCGEFRPSAYTPLPEVLSPHPLRKNATSGCPGRIFTTMHPERSGEEPFFDPVRGEGWHHGAQEAKESIDKLIEADAYDNIFPVMAHDNSLAGIIDVYPKTANDWMAKGWKEKSRWGFLGEFAATEDDPPHTALEEGAKAAEARKDSRVSPM